MNEDLNALLASEMSFNTPFLIVTPTFNSEHYLDETIISVISQSGPFEIIYHVQDGGSTDRTLSILRRWQRLIDNGDFPINCNGLRFSYASERDGGMYQAINRGIAAARPEGLFLMGWVNSDDRLAPGALATLELVYQTFPHVRFTTARVALIDDRGSLMGVNLPMDYNQGALMRGEHDGRTQNFVMQEGTFWRSDLWDAVGGLDERFRLAGDWDLWRRFGAQAPLHTIDTLIGFHRRRPGQLSAEMDRYYAEVDMAQAEAADQAAAMPTMPNIGMIRFDMGKQRWIEYSDYGRRLDVPMLQDASGDRQQAIRITPLSGVRRAEGPYPEGGLPAGMQWVDNTSMTAEVTVPLAGRWTMTLRARSWRPRLKVRIARGTAICYDDVLSAGEQHADSEIRTDVWLEAGHNVLSIESSGEVGDPGSWLFIILDWYVQPEAPRALPSPAGALTRRLARSGIAWPRISVVVPSFNQGHFLEETLQSLLDQNYPDLEIIVVDGGSTDATRDILARYADHFAYYRSAPDGGQSAAINWGFARATGTILTWLNSDDLLEPGALFAIARTFAGPDAPDMVAGVCTSFDKSGDVRRHLPCLADGPLPLQQILDIEGSWLQGRFFHQPEVFFTRAIWDSAGGRVDEQLHYSMDYDLWARLAKAGARIQVIGAHIARFRLHPAQKTSSPEVYSPELRAHAAHLTRRLGTVPARPVRTAIQSLLTIVMFNDYGYKYGAGVAHRRLATALTGFGHRVVPIAYADFDLGTVERSVTAEMIVDTLLAESPDLVVLGNQHAIAADFLGVMELLVARGIPTVFFAHDEWIITGRCGYTGGCTRLETACDASCPTAAHYPALPPEQVLPAFVRKRELLTSARKAPFAIFTNSGYMSERIERMLGIAGGPPVRDVRLGVDCTIFAPQNRVLARRQLGLPEDAFIVLTAAADLGDERKGFARALAAFRALASPGKLLLVMGLRPANAPEDEAIFYSGNVGDEHLAALHYAAADLLLSAANQEAFGQTLIEAAATGCPSIALAVGGVTEAVRDGETGILVRPLAPAALSVALQQLHDDPVRRERLGSAGVLHARTRYSLEACAWSFLTALEQLGVFAGVPMAPNLVQSVDEPLAPFLTYLAGPRATLSPDDGWEPALGLLREREPVPEIGLDQGYVWLEHPSSRVFVRALHHGIQTLHIHGRSIIRRQQVRVAVNGEHVAVLQYDQDDPRIRESRQIRAMLVPGMNRIDFDFAVKGGFLHEPRALTFRLEGVDVGEREAGGGGTAWQPLSGFGQLEGPYLEHNITRPFRWIEKPTARLRAYSDKSLKTQLRITCRNHLAGQWIEIAVNGATAGTVRFENAAFIELYEVLLPVAVVRGWNVISIKVGVSGTSTDERELLVAVDSIELVEVERPIGRVTRYYESGEAGDR